MSLPVPQKPSTTPSLRLLRRNPQTWCWPNPSSWEPRSYSDTSVQRVRRSSCARSFRSRSKAATPHRLAPDLPPARFLNRPRNAALAAVNRRILRQAYQTIDTLHSEVHGNAMPGTLVDWGRRADAIVQFSVPSFEYPRSDAPATLHFAGPLSATGSQAPLPDWWSDLDGTRPVIHVTQGTVANTDYGQVIAPTLRGLADDDVLVVVTTGNRALDTLPPNTRAATYLPYDELLPRTDVYVTNGGYGGLALRCADRRHRRQGGQARGGRPRRMVRGRPTHQKRTPDTTRFAPRHPGRAESAALPPGQPPRCRRHGCSPRLRRFGRHR